MCSRDTDQLEGKDIITVEGVSEWEKQVYTYAYGKAGAVQCGFCIPGMVMCTKALLDKNMEPSDDEIRYALRNNYCRCTGYIKIMDAVRLSARILKEGILPDDGDPSWTLGSQSFAELMWKKKFLEQENIRMIFIWKECFTALHFRSQYARARVLSIDTSKARALARCRSSCDSRGYTGRKQDRTSET